MEIVSRHPFRVTPRRRRRGGGGRGRATSWLPSRVCSGAAAAASPVRLEIDRSMTDEVLALLTRARPRARRRVRLSRDPGPGRAHGALPPRPPRPEGRAVTPVTQPRLVPRRAEPDCSRSCAAATSWSTTRTTRSQPRRGVPRAGRARPDVLAIKQTLYRTSAQESPIIRCSHPGRRGREAGGRPRRAESPVRRAGEHHVRTSARGGRRHVAYGVVGLKTTRRPPSSVRREEGGVRRYAHVAPATTTLDREALRGHGPAHRRDPRSGRPHRPVQPAHGYSRQREYRRLLVAPHDLRPSSSI